MRGSIGKKVVFFSAVYLTIILILNASLVSCISTNNSNINNNDDGLVIMNDNPPLGDGYVLFPEDEIGILGIELDSTNPYNYAYDLKFFDENGTGVTPNWASFNDYDSHYRAIKVFDIDVDGYEDVILLKDSEPTKIKIYYPRNGNTKDLILTGNGYARDIACGDFDGNLDMEIAVLMCEEWPKGKTLVIIDDNGIELTKYPLELPSNNIAWKNITAGDLNGDLIDEVIALSTEPYGSKGSKICVVTDVPVTYYPIKDAKFNTYDTGKACIGMSCGYFFSDDNPDPDEQITESIVLSSSDSVKIINFAGETLLTLLNWKKIPNSVVGFISAGDFDADGDSEIVTANKIGEVQIWDPPELDTNPFPSVLKHFNINDDVDFDDMHWIAGIYCGNSNGNGIKVKHNEDEKRYMSTEYYPIALLYIPPCNEYNYHDYTQTYSAYGWGHAEGEEDVNSVTLETYSQISFGGSISNILNLKVRMELDKYITKIGGVETVKRYTTKCKTGNKKEPYVLCEKTNYIIYIYEFKNGPTGLKGKKFALSMIDKDDETDIKGYGLSYYNSYVAKDPKLKINPEHTTLDPASYIYKNPRGFYDKDLQNPSNPEPTSETVNKYTVTIDEIRSKEFIESNQVSYNLDLATFLVPLGYDSTKSLTEKTSHKITVGTSTTFECQIGPLDSKYQSEWDYKSQMYVRRDPQYNYVIIDFYVDPTSLGTAYGQDDTTPPTVNIESPRKGYLYFNGREIIRCIPESANCDSFAYGEATLSGKANDEQTGVDCVNVYYDEIKYNAILNSNGDWQFPISNHNPKRLEFHSYQAEAKDCASPTGNTALTEKRIIASIQVYDIDTNTAPFLSFEENSYNAVKISEKTYSFTANLVDVDGDDIFYRYHWGDGTNSGWIGPIKTNNLIDSTNSNELTPITAEHEYQNKGSYLVELEVKDSNGNHGLYNLTYDVTVSRTVNRFPIYNFENLIMFLESIIEKLFSFF